MLSTAGSELRSHPVVVSIGAVTAACAVLGAAAIERGQLRAESPTLAAFTIVAGVSFVSAGLVASFRRSERWTGVLMVGAGFTLFAGTLIQANRSVLFTAGLAVIAIPTAVLEHLVLAFPDGRLHSIWERLLVGAAYLNAVVVQILMLMFMGIGQVGGCPCPHNLLFVRDDTTVHMRLMSIERYTGLAVAVGVALVLALRWSGASPLLRRALFPILVSGGVAISLVAAMLLANSLPYAGASIKLQSAERVAFGVVPIAYLVGLFRTRLGRVGVSDLIVELGRGLEPGRLRDAIARSLRDPSLELGYWIRDSDEYVEATPKSLRLRKRILDATQRKRAAANLSLVPA